MKTILAIFVAILFLTTFIMTSQCSNFYQVDYSTEKVYVFNYLFSSSEEIHFLKF